MEFHWSDPDLDLLRASVATITSYLFFIRGECGACAERGDIVVDEHFITLLLRHEKGKNALGAGRRNVRQIPCIVVPRIAALLRAFFAGQHCMEGLQGKCLRRWAIGPSEDKVLWSADTLSVGSWTLAKLSGATPPKVSARCRTLSAKGLAVYFRRQRHRCSFGGHPLNRWMVHQLDCLDGK